jgi:hypothetical protein
MLFFSFLQTDRLQCPDCNKTFDRKNQQTFEIHKKVHLSNVQSIKLENPIQQVKSEAGSRDGNIAPSARANQTNSPVRLTEVASRIEVVKNCINPSEDFDNSIRTFYFSVKL